MKRTKRAPEERGETLVELLITVVIMGIAFTALLAGLGVAMSSGRFHRQQANADTVIVSVADSVKSQTLNPYIPCNQVKISTTPRYNPTNGVTLPSAGAGAGWTSANVTVTAIKGWTGSAWATCTSSSVDNNLELVTIQVVTPGDPATTETVDVVKRNPEAG
jgi:prepilin-type N-terminal cleavage/methylation domain-containing protein